MASRQEHNPLRQAMEHGQAIWSDYIRRGSLLSGEFQRLVDQGLGGVTSNPTIFERAIVGSADYDVDLESMARAGHSPIQIYEALAIEDIQGAADVLRPLYDLTDGLHGYASLEVSPLLSEDTEGTVAEAKRLFARLDRPNAMIKVPATPEGIPAIRALIGEGININVTLLFSLQVYGEVREAYIGGIEDLMGTDIGRLMVRADVMREACASCVRPHENPGQADSLRHGLGGDRYPGAVRLAERRSAAVRLHLSEVIEDVWIVHRPEDVVEVVRRRIKEHERAESGTPSRGQGEA